VESERHALWDLHRGDRARGDIARVEDDEIGGVAVVVVHRVEQPAVVFCAARGARRKDAFTDLPERPVPGIVWP